MNRKNLKKSRSLSSKIIRCRKLKRKNMSLMKKRLILKRCLLVTVVLLFIGMLFGGVHLTLSKFFSIKDISIDGNSDYTEQEITNAGDIHRGDSWLFLNTKSSENKIYKSLTNIDSIHISKKFPNKLNIVAEQATPRYWLKSENEYFIVSKNKKFLEKSSEMPESLIGIIGINFEVKETGNIEFKDAELENLIKEILDSFESKSLDEVKAVDISDLQNITINYNSRIMINVGDKEDIDYKVLTSKEIINDKISKTEKGTLNLKNLKSENRTYFTYE